MQYNNRPAECFRNSDGDSSVDCTKVDVWALGILAANIFTGMYLENKLPDEVNCWSKDVYPQIVKVLKVTLNKYFMSVFAISFSGVTTSSGRGGM